MRRVFDLDVCACARCGGRMSVIATIEAGELIRTILGLYRRDQGMVRLFGRDPQRDALR